MTERLGQFARFLIVGGVATACHYALLVMLVEAVSVSPVRATSAGALLGAVVSYVLNRRLTFESDKSHAFALPRFLLIAATAMAANAGLMALFTGLLALPYLLAQLVTTALIILLTYNANRLWTFRS